MIRRRKRKQARKISLCGSGVKHVRMTSRELKEYNFVNGVRVSTSDSEGMMIYDLRPTRNDYLK
jgi:hypothetical protein